MMYKFKDEQCFANFCVQTIPTQRKLGGGYIGITLSVCLSGCLSSPVRGHDFVHSWSKKSVHGVVGKYDCVLGFIELKPFWFISYKSKITFFPFHLICSEWMFLYFILFLALFIKPRGVLVMNGQVKFYWSKRILIS